MLVDVSPELAKIERRQARPAFDEDLNARRPSAEWPKLGNRLAITRYCDRFASLNPVDYIATMIAEIPD